MSLRRGLLAWLVFALLVAQTLGLMHRVVHAPLGNAPLGNAPLGHAPVALATPSLHTPAFAEAGAHNHGHEWLAELFAGHDDSSCRLYDALGHGDALCGVPALALPLVPAAFVLAFFQGEAVARWAALFDARGPPSRS